MIVVSDTSPLNYLHRIGLVDVLPQLYGSVYIPHEVHSTTGIRSFAHAPAMGHQSAAVVADSICIISFTGD